MLELIFEIIFGGFIGGFFKLLFKFFRIIGAFVMSLFTLLQKPVSHYYKEEEDLFPTLLGFFLMSGIVTYLILK